MRREAWQAQQLRQELFGNRPMSGSMDGGSLGGPTIRPVMDLGDMGDLGKHFRLIFIMVVILWFLQTTFQAYTVYHACIWHNKKS